MLKLIKGKNVTTPFLPLDSKKGGPVKYAKDRKAIYLTEEQMRCIYKKVESGSEINTNTMKQEIDNEKLTSTKTEEERNPYQKLVLNNVYKDEIKTAQMQHWSILSDNVKYVLYDEESKAACDLDVKTLDYRHHKKLHNSLKGEEKQMLDMDFGDNPDLLETNYLDMYEGVHAGVIYSTRFDENSDLSTTYLGRMTMTRKTKARTEEKFPISGQGFTTGKLLDDTDCQIL